MLYVSTFLISIIITVTMIPLVNRVSTRLNLLDDPGIRKVHTVSVPKSGGIAMAVGTIFSAFLWLKFTAFIYSVLMGVGIVVVFGILDDIFVISYKIKFLGQVIATFIVIYFGGLVIKDAGSLLPDGVQLPPVFAIPLTLFAIVGVTNAINLSDGLDGLAGGISLLCFISIGYFAYILSDQRILLICVAAAGSILGFLRFNTYPATVFMGDTGSQFLGFLAVTLSIYLSQKHETLSPLFPLIILGFPVLDTLTVMVERIKKGSSPFVADKNHLHHKLIKLGFYHWETVSIIYLLNAFLVSIVFVFRFHSEWFLLSFYLTFSFFIYSLFYIARSCGWQLEHTVSHEISLKNRLGNKITQGILIASLFMVTQIIIPFQLLITCIVPKTIPFYFAVFSFFLATLIIVIWKFRKEWLPRTVLFSLYLEIPFLIYLSEKLYVGWLKNGIKDIYNLFFGIMVLMVILTLKFTRRKKGFKSTPLDFIIFFIAIVVPNLPTTDIQHSVSMGAMASKIIAFLFSFEVLVGELRSEVEKLAAIAILAFILITIRGFLSI